jgi:hypothetical protein
MTWLGEENHIGINSDSTTRFKTISTMKICSTFCVTEEAAS